MKLKFAAIIALSVAALSAHPVSVHAAGSTPPPTARILPNGTQGPNLTAAQESKALALKKKMAADYMALMKNKKLTNTQKQAKFVALEKKFQANMLAILTPAQRTEVLARQADANARMKQIQDVRDRLIKSLTPAQQKQIQQLQQDNMKEIEAIRNDKSLSNDQKNQKMNEAAKNAQAKWDAILTPAQRDDVAKLQALYPAPPPPQAPK